MSALTDHRKGLCACADPNVTKPCVYAAFPDGWEFVPEVGNGGSRGEVFTPLWVVQKMIVDSGMLPEAVVYRDDHASVSDKQAAKLIRNRVIEPAVGTANFTSVILYHKLRLVPRIVDPTKDRERFDKWFMTAVGSMYSFDIDAGNIVTTRKRLLGDSSPINSDDQVFMWTTVLSKGLFGTMEPPTEHSAALRSQIVTSLTEAEEHWGRFTKSNVGVIDAAYEELTGEELSNDLHEQCAAVVAANTQMFNGIVEEDTTDKMYCPGWSGVEWVWWDFSKSPFESKQAVQSFGDMIRQGQLDDITRKLAAEGLTPTELRKLNKEKVALENKLKPNAGGFDFF